MGLLMIRIHRLVENVPLMHPIALGRDFNGGRRLFRMADKADAPGVYPYQRGKIAPTKFADDRIVDGTNSSVRWAPIRSGIFLGGLDKKSAVCFSTDCTHYVYLFQL